MPKLLEHSHGVLFRQPKEHKHSVSVGAQSESLQLTQIAPNFSNFLPLRHVHEYRFHALAKLFRLSHSRDFGEEKLEVGNVSFDQPISSTG